MPDKDATIHEKRGSAASAQFIADQLVAWASETGTSGEAAFAERLRSLLVEIPYFKDRPDQVVLIESHGTPPRFSVAALVRGIGTRCVVLTGHYDTVGVVDYGELSPLARDPDALRAALISDLSTRPRNAAEALALNDLTEGSYRPGRGMLDMKSGDAAGIVALERFSEVYDRRGNMLLLLTPDEESQSRGMRSARDSLPNLANRWGLDIVLGLNLDAVTDLTDGSRGRSIHLGSVGKLMPFAFVIGRPTHAGYPFHGISTHLIGAEIIQAVEANPALCDEAYGEWSPPPICLEARDLRLGYDVTTPGAMWLAFNWLTHQQSPESVLTRFREISEQAMRAAIEKQAEHARVFYATTGEPRPEFPEGVIWSFADLTSRAMQVGGRAAADRHQALLETLAKEENPLVVSRLLVQDLVASAGIVGPAVIVGFGGLRYPHVHVHAQDEPLIAAVVAAAIKAAATHQMILKRREFFSGISDMSFLGVQPEAQTTRFVAANTTSPSYVDATGSNLLRFPLVNIGPWGRDYHQKFERVHTVYAFEVLPDVVFEAASAALHL
jgi:arginine utilization protein RocB